MTPADTFMSLWRLSLQWDGPTRRRAIKPTKTFTRTIQNCLTLDDGQSCFDLLAENLLDSLKPGKEVVGEVLEAMRLMDDLFYAVHPRHGVLSPATSKPVKVPKWLRRLRDFRTLNGYYCRDGDLALIPRGPLLRRSRNPDAAYADSLADRFAALSLVPVQSKHDDRDIAISLVTVSANIARGVPVGKNRGGEIVAFIPVGEDSDDVVILEHDRASEKFASFGVNPSLDVAGRIMGALEHVPDADIAVAPEFMVSEKASDALSNSIALSTKSRVRLLVAGTGATDEQHNSQPWNECQILNGCGYELWRQRKIWPAGLATDTATAYGLADPGQHNLIWEDTAAGNTISVVDLAGIGRCVILICQDLKANVVTPEVIKHFQPDWVITPIFDTGVCEGRWMHNEAWQLSELAQSRFLIGSSLSMGKKTGHIQAYGMAVGPKELAGEIIDGLTFENRAFAYAEEVAINPRVATVKWGQGKWLQTTLGAKGPKPKDPTA